MATLAQLKEQLGSKPVTGYAPPKQNIAQKAAGFVGGVAKDAYSALIGTPGTKIGQAIVAPLNLQKNQTTTALQNTNTTTAQMLADRAKTETNPTLKAQYQKQAADLLNQGQPFAQAPDQSDSNASGVNVPAQKTGLAGVEQIGGQALKSASYLVGGGEAGAAADTAGVGGKILAGTKLGGAVGALGGAGNAMEQGGNLSQVAGSALQGAAIGGLTGGVIGVASAAIHPIFNRATPIMNPTDLADATAAREAASTGGVNAINEMNQTVGADQTSLGEEFKQGAVNIEKANPQAKLNLSGKQLDALNSLKESKLFSLPENLDNSSSGANIGGSEFKIGNPKVASQIEGLQNETASSLSPTQAQDLVTRLNKLTFASKASGDLAVNQQTIGLTNEIKSAASKTFGPEWDKFYSNYTQGRTVMDKLDGIVNLDPKATPMDFNKQLGTIQKLGETPEGQKFLQQAIDEYKNVRGIDLTDPVAAANHVLKAQGELEIAQKGTHAHQILQALKSPNLQARQIARVALTLLGITAGATAFRKQIGQFFSGQ